MEADFSGYATKAGLKCSDGRVIAPDAFKHQDTTKVPLVWQHGHSDPQNVLGHAILENRADGVYAYAFFNDTGKAVHARELVEHKDITMMSIWANDLIERAKHVLHGVIREVSLVLSGANPGALIENVSIRHSDDEVEVLDEEAIIYTGLAFDTLPEMSHAVANVNDTAGGATSSTDTSTGDLTIQEVYDSMTPEQQDVLHLMVGEALQTNPPMAQSAIDNEKDDEEDDGDASGDLSHDTNDDNDSKGSEMKHNVFENSDEGTKEAVLSHDDMEGILADATRRGSLKDAVTEYGIAHGIVDLDVLFPDAVNLDNEPQFLQRRVEWVNTLLGAVRKSPFSRVRTQHADLTLADARAKGYVTGALKNEEFFGVSRRITTPTTVYKKQTLDRDDVVDITDFDVVAWLKSEMRVMLDEEIARAILIGDGRNIADADKINEGNIRPIAGEHELFATTVVVNTKDASSTVAEVVDAIIANRRHYKGTGQPNMYCSETLISQFLLLKDTLGRRLYKDLTEIATELRVAAIIPVEVMEDVPDLLAIIVNPVDYVVGATAGGQVNLFDDFDIDYNKQKYLIETRCSGALTRLKSALIVRAVAAGTDTVVVPNAPTYVQATGIVTIVATTGVTYQNADTGATLATGAQAAIPVDSQINIVAVPAAGRFLATDATAYWTFLRP